MSRLSIYYGRIRYIEPRPGQESFLPPGEPIREAVETAAATSVQRYRHEWVLGNLAFEDDPPIITGRLGYPAQESVTREDLDPTTHAFVEAEYELPNALSSLFVLNYQTGAIASEGDKIGPTGFVNHLVALLNSAGRRTFRGELIRVADDYREFIRVVDKVTRVSFEVRPTNPRDRVIFRPLDAGMKAAGARRQRVLIENEDEGLRVVPPDTRDESTDNPALMGIEMNEEGYGEGYRIDAERDGRPLRFESKGGGLLKDVLEDASDEPEPRTQALVEGLSERSDSLQPGHETAPPLEAGGDDFDEAEDEDNASAEWPEDE